MDDTIALMQLRAISIQFLKALEDDLIARGVIAPADRACLTRQERRQLRIVVETTAAADAVTY